MPAAGRCSTWHEPASVLHSALLRHARPCQCYLHAQVFVCNMANTRKTLWGSQGEHCAAQAGCHINIPCEAAQHMLTPAVFLIFVAGPWRECLSSAAL